MTLRAKGGGGRGVGRGGRNASGTIEGSRVTNVILGTYHNAPVASYPLLKLHQPILSMIGGQGGR